MIFAAWQDDLGKYIWRVYQGLWLICAPVGVYVGCWWKHTK